MKNILIILLLVLLGCSEKRNEVKYPETSFENIVNNVFKKDIDTSTNKVVIGQNSALKCNKIEMDSAKVMEAFKNIK